MRDEMGTEFDQLGAKDRQLAALAYALSPLVPVVILLRKDLWRRPYLRAHASQAFFLGVGLWGILVPLSLGCGSVAWLGLLFLAWRAYQGQRITIPWLSEFLEARGWKD